MIGAITGDIVGSIYEFNNIKVKEFEFFGEGCGFTDDTLMTIAVSHAFMESRERNQDFETSVINKMREYARKYPGIGYGPLFQLWLMSDCPRPYNSFGNGSAMRVSACGFAAKDLKEALRLAEQSAKVTHNHPEGIKGAQAAAGAIFLAKSGRSKEEIKKYIVENFYELSESLDDIRSKYKFSAACQDTVPQAIQAFLESENYEDAIRNAVSLGGDSATLAAITGTVAEAFYGIPKEIQQKTLTYLPSELQKMVFKFEKTYQI